MVVLENPAPSRSILHSISKHVSWKYCPPFDLAMSVDLFTNREYRFVLPSPNTPPTSYSYHLFNSSALALNSSFEALGGISARRWSASVAACDPPEGRTIHAQRDLRALGLKVLRRGLQAVPWSMLVLVGFVIAGGGFGGRRGILGYLLGETGRGIFFAWVDGHGEW